MIRDGPFFEPPRRAGRGASATRARRCGGAAERLPRCRSRDTHLGRRGHDGNGVALVVYPARSQAETARASRIRVMVELDDGPYFVGAWVDDSESEPRSANGWRRGVDTDGVGRILQWKIA